MKGVRDALTILNSKSRERLDRMHDAYKQKSDSGDKISADRLKVGINTYLTCLQDLGIISQLQWRSLYIYFTR